MSSYFKALGLHVYLATIKRSYIDNGKYVEANAQAMIALKQTLSKDYLFYDFSLRHRFCSVEYVDLS